MLILTETRPFPDTPKTLASRSALPPKSPKIIKKISQGATPGHYTLQSPNFARCDTATSHLATLSHRTLRHRAIVPCHFRLSHPATRKPRLWHDFWRQRAVLQGIRGAPAKGRRLSGGDIRRDARRFLTSLHTSGSSACFEQHVERLMMHVADPDAP